MRIAYIIGPYRASTKEEVQENIQNAAEVAQVLWDKGFAVICPHTNSANFEETDDRYLRGYLEIIKRLEPARYIGDGNSDIVVTLPNWVESEGSKKEVAFAINRKIPRVHWVG